MSGTDVQDYRIGTFLKPFDCVVCVLTEARALGEVF